MLFLVASATLTLAALVSAQNTCQCNTFEPCRAQFALAQSACLTLSNCLQNLTEVTNPQQQQFVIQCYVNKQEQQNRLSRCVEQRLGPRCTNTFVFTRHRGGGGFGDFFSGYFGGRGERNTASTPGTRSYLRCVRDCVQNPPQFLLDQARQQAQNNGRRAFNFQPTTQMLGNSKFTRGGGGGGLMKDYRFCERQLNCRSVRYDRTQRQQAKTQCEQQLGITRTQIKQQLCQCLQSAGLSVTCTTTTSTSTITNGRFSGRTTNTGPFGTNNNRFTAGNRFGSLFGRNNWFWDDNSGDE